jgi:hypothetical protein
MSWNPVYESEADYMDYLHRFLRDIEESFQAKLLEERRRPRNSKSSESPPSKPPMSDRWVDTMVEYAPGEWRSGDVREYNDSMWPSSYPVFSDLIRSKFIDLNLTTGTATQLRDYKTGRELEKPLPIRPIERANDYWLEVEVWGEPKTTRTVRMRIQKLVFYMSKTHLTPDEWMSQVHGREIHHKDGDRSHNWISNLVALTPAEHRKVGKQTGVHKQTERGISRDDPVVAKIKQLRTDGLSYLSFGPYATAESVWRSISTHSGEGTSWPDAP